MLSEHETIALSKLQKQHKNWPRQRLYMLFGGLLVLAYGLWMWVKLIGRAEAAVIWDGEVVLLCPIVFVAFAQGLILCINVLMRWRGDPISMLLLTLLEKEDQKTKDQVIPEKGQDKRHPLP